MPSSAPRAVSTPQHRLEGVCAAQRARTTVHRPVRPSLEEWTSGRIAIIDRLLSNNITLEYINAMWAALLNQLTLF